MKRSKDSCRLIWSFVTVLERLRVVPGTLAIDQRFWYECIRIECDPDDPKTCALARRFKLENTRGL